jgi:hypothetical protein
MIKLNGFVSILVIESEFKKAKRKMYDRHWSIEVGIAFRSRLGRRAAGKSKRQGLLRSIDFSLNKIKPSSGFVLPDKVLAQL